MQNIEVIARAVIINKGMILLARARGSTNTFLPGGHIEEGEFSREALRRELKEELGVETVVGHYVGTLEYIYHQNNGSLVHEINIIFEVKVHESNVSSHESKLEFIWVKPGELEKAVLLPEPLPELLTSWKKTGEPFYECMIESDRIRHLLSQHS